MEFIFIIWFNISSISLCWLLILPAIVNFIVSIFSLLPLLLSFIVFCSFFIMIFELFLFGNVVLLIIVLELSDIGEIWTNFFLLICGWFIFFGLLYGSFFSRLFFCLLLSQDSFSFFLIILFLFSILFLSLKSFFISIFFFSSFCLCFGITIFNFKII